MKFLEFIEINPKVELRKGLEYPCVLMDEVEPGNKWVSGNIIKPYKGGTKFQKGDTLFAQITPCLENGKIAKYKGDKNNFGFGSTEFFVFRAKEGISDEDYIYYLSRSDIIRKPAEVSMFGASGRQRADLDFVQNIQINPPNLETQRKIAAILSAFDDLIENNTRRIKILEEIAQRLYREWFVHFRYPGHENVNMIYNDELGKEISEGWKVSRLEKVLKSIESGSRPKGGIDPNVTEVPSIGAENILGLGKYEYSKEKYVTREFYDNMRKGHIKSGDVLLYKDGAKIGRKSMFMNRFPYEECCINEHVFILRTNNLCSQAYLYFWLDLPNVTQNIINLNANAAQPGINQEGVKSIKILLANNTIMKIFDELVYYMLRKIFNLSKKNKMLRKTRDLLLPRLISGKIDV